MFLRRSNLSDAPQISGLASGNCGPVNSAIITGLSTKFEGNEKIFGKTSVVNALEKAVLSITAVNDAGAVLGSATFHDAPSSLSTPSVDPTR